MTSTPSAGPYAPAREDGLLPYVVTKTSWAKSWDRIEYAASLAEAKRSYGWTRELHASIKVRRARLDDVEKGSGPS